MNGLTGNLAIWIDDVSVNDVSGSVVEGFEASTVGAEAMFQEPGFSGSTSGNINGGQSIVTDAMALNGNNSTRVDFQFIDNDPARWLRLTTFSRSLLPLGSPAIRVTETGGPAPTLTFWLKGIPEPTSFALFAMAGLGLATVRRR